MRALLTLSVALILPLAANADPISPGTVSDGGFYMSEILPADLNQGETDFTIVDVDVPPFSTVVTGLTCNNNYICAAAAPGTNGATLTFSSAPDPSVQISVSLPGSKASGEDVQAIVRYFYAVAGGATTGTLTFNLSTSQSGYDVSPLPSAGAQIIMDGVNIAGCSSKPYPPDYTFTEVVPCTGSSLTGTAQVNLLAQGEIDLSVSVEPRQVSGQGSTAFALIDPTLTADNGAVITLSDGFGNGVPAPEPAALGLIVPSLACLAALRRRRYASPPRC